MAERGGDGGDNGKRKGEGGRIYMTGGHKTSENPGVQN